MKILIENKIEKFKKQHKLKAKFNIKVQSEAIKKGSNKPDSRYEDLGRLLDSELPSFELRNISSEFEFLIKQWCINIMLTKQTILILMISTCL